MSCLISLFFVVVPYTYLWFVNLGFSPTSLAIYLMGSFLVIPLQWWLVSVIPITSLLTGAASFFLQPWFYWENHHDMGYFGGKEKWLYWVDITEGDFLFNPDLNISQVDLTVCGQKIVVTDFFYHIPFLGARRRICFDITDIGVTYGISKTFQNQAAQALNDFMYNTEVGFDLKK